MKKFSLILGAGFLALSAMAGVAQAGGSFDDDDDYNSGYGYRRESLSRYCYQHPDDSRCDPSGYRYKPRKPAYSDYSEGACRATIRSAGTRNLIGAFARNSAIFSWQREVRAVYGPQYAHWGQARSVSLSCGPGGGALTACVASARPCRD